MRVPGAQARIRLALALPALAAGLLASPAAAATKIGLADSGALVVCPANNTFVQIGTGPPSPSYAVPAGGGVVTSWELEANGGSGSSMELKLFRPTATANTFTVVGKSGFEPVATGVQQFATQIPVQAGDLLGFTTGPTSVTGCLRATSPATDVRGSSPNSDPAVGSAFTPAAVFDQQALSIAALIEPDADGDGFGDQTQDTCPASTGTANGCDVLAPETTIDNGPREKLKTRRKKALVKFVFSSPERSVFHCRLDDGPGRECVSPYLRRVKPGRHTFTVWATDAAGNLDPTPASAGFKVKRRGH